MTTDQTAPGETPPSDTLMPERMPPDSLPTDDPTTTSVRPADVPGLTWRPITEVDLPDWHRLVRAVEDADDLSEHNTLEDLRDELLEGSWKQPERDSVLGVDDQGVARAFGHVDVRPGDVSTVRAFCWGAVDPAWRRRGVGSAVLGWQEARGRQKIAAIGSRTPGPSRPGRLLVHAQEELHDRGELLRRNGFRAVRWYLEMSRPLTGDGAQPPPQVTLDGGLRLVPYEQALDEPVRLAHNEAFASHWGSEPRDPEDWRQTTTGSRWFKPEWSFVVLDGDQVAGYTIASAYLQDWPSQGYTSGWTDLVGVRPAWRGRRVAPALLSASMRAFAADGIERADLGVDSENPSGALGLYGSLGYHQVRRNVAWAKDV